MANGQESGTEFGVRTNTGINSLTTFHDLPMMRQNRLKTGEYNNKKDFISASILHDY